MIRLEMNHMPPSDELWLDRMMAQGARGYATAIEFVESGEGRAARIAQQKIAREDMKSKARTRLRRYDA